MSKFKFITKEKKIRIELHPNPNGQKKKKRIKDQIEFDIDKVDRFLKIMKRVETLPFRETVNFAGKIS